MYTKKPFITISREYGAEGWILALELEKEINKLCPDEPWKAYNREILKHIEENKNISSDLIESLEKPAQSAISSFIDSILSTNPDRLSIFKNMAEVIKALALKGRSIIVGRGGCFITHDLEKGFHIRVVAPKEWRVKLISEQKGISELQSKLLVEKMENERDAFIKDYFFTDVSNPSYYDLVINSSKISIEDSIEIILHLLKKRNYI